MESLVIDIEHEYVYDESRVCKKTCLLMKTFGFGWYMSGAVACVSHSMFIPYSIMLATMFAACCNSARYEYALYKKHGTRFCSLEEFNAWKNQQLPKLNEAFDSAEVIIKLCFLIASWPLNITFFDGTRNNAFSMCELNMSVLKIHAVIIMIVYSCALLLFMCLWCSFFNNTEWVPSPGPNLNTTPSQSPTYAIYTNEHACASTTLECCICLNTKTEPWVSTRCAHVFHRECLSAWTQFNATCPICRTSLT